MYVPLFLHPSPRCGPVKLAELILASNCSHTTANRVNTWDYQRGASRVQTARCVQLVFPMSILLLRSQLQREERPESIELD